MATTTFMTAPRWLFTSESVTEGHPDKLCDQISDAVLDAIYEQDPRGRVACEAVATADLIVVTGEITTSAAVDITQIVRDTARRVGYTRADYGLDADRCEVLVRIKRQSADIARGVDAPLEVRTGQASETEGHQLGAGDQGMMIGFACSETPQLMPLPITLAHRLCQRLAEVRKSGVLPSLRPDGKAQVTVEYAHGRPARVATVVVAAQHEPDVDLARLRDDITQQVVRATVPAELLDGATRFLVNPAGPFVTGGPLADAGLTGRKIMVDTYGGMARHGGGCFSGKDPTKVDRSGAYAARYVAKNLVAAGLAERCELQIAYAIGVARPLAMMVECFGTNRIPVDRILRLVEERFDLRPRAIIRDLRLQRPIYRPTACYGHFGRTDIDAPWEQTDRAAALRQAAGLG